MRRARRVVRRRWRRPDGSKLSFFASSGGRPPSPLAVCGALVSLAEGWIRQQRHRQRGSNPRTARFARTNHECLWSNTKRTSVASSRGCGRGIKIGAGVCTGCVPTSRRLRTKKRNPLNYKRVALFTNGEGGGNRTPRQLFQNQTLLIQNPRKPLQISAVTTPTSVAINRSHAHLRTSHTHLCT
jgi:hypothetical protein